MSATAMPTTDTPVDTGLTLAHVEAFESELMHAQWMLGVLGTVGGDTAGYAAEIGEIARRGAELLAGRASQ